MLFWITCTENTVEYWITCVLRPTVEYWITSVLRPLWNTFCVIVISFWIIWITLWNTKWLSWKYAPYFHLIVDSNTNEKTLKCKLCSSGSTLTYHGNTSVMKSHLEAKHNAEYRKMIGETSGSGQLRASSFIQPTFKQFVGQSGMPWQKQGKILSLGNWYRCVHKIADQCQLLKDKVSKSSVLHLILSTKFQ